MAYYLVCFETELRDQFQKRFAFLGSAITVKNKQHLEEILSQKKPNSFFLVYFKGSSTYRDDLVLTIKEQAHEGKLIYVGEGKTVQDLKAHQLTPVGGDGYVDLEVKEETLTQVIEGLRSGLDESPPETEQTETSESTGFSDRAVFDRLKSDPVSMRIDAIFATVIKPVQKKALWQSATDLTEVSDVELNVNEESDDIGTKEAVKLGDDMSDKDQELSLDDMVDLELGEDAPPVETPEDDGMEMSLDAVELDLSGDDDAPAELPDEETEGLSSSDLDFDNMDINLDDDNVPSENLGDLDFSTEPEGDKSSNFSLSKINLTDDSDDEVKLSDGTSLNVDLGGDLSSDDEVALDFGDSDLSGLDFDADDVSENSDLSDEAKKKLREIDEIMVKDATLASISIQDVQGGEDFIMDASLDEPLVSDDLNLDSINFGSSESEDQPTRVKKLKDMEKEDEPTRVRVLKSEDLDDEVEEKPKKKKKETRDRDLGSDLKEISGAYSGELERTGATISNLRADREELLAKIQKLEESQMLHNRQTLSLRAELDEKKIELSIIRKNRNEEVSELKDRLKLFDEKRMIQEEKIKYLTQELDKAGQKNKIDVKKVQMRERELEQKLELLKSDAETQIRNRDLKILELKRKIDAMEFDMESISNQEKRSVESRFELEDKLDKAIKTLRGAITVLEDESQRGNALEALKKNIDM
jgi:hypothetical protein